MRSSIYALPLRHVAAWGFLLNAFWEFGQCVFFYEMWGWGFWRATAWMWGAILGDVVIVLGVAVISRVTYGVTGAISFESLEWSAWTILLATGFVASLVLEWAARAFGLWSYSALMPTVHIASYEVGLLPIAQVTLLPALSVWLAIRSSSSS